MHSEDYFRLFGLLSVVLTWLSIGYILTTIERDLSKAISYHAAMQRKNYRIFSVLMSTSLVVMGVFMFMWFIPTLHLSVLFSSMIVLALLLEFVATLVPLSNGWRSTVHQIMSYGTSLLLPILLLMLVLSGMLSGTAFCIAFGSFMLMLFIWFLFIFIKKTHGCYLIYQSIYILAFHTALIAVAYF